MKSILERLRALLRSVPRRARDSAPGQDADATLPFEYKCVQIGYEDPYAEMRRALAIMMLLG